MPNIGVPELLILLVILLLIFGPKRLPGLGRQLGSGMREFKDSITGKSKDEDEIEEREEPLRSLDSSATASERRDPAPPAA